MKLHHVVGCLLVFGLLQACEPEAGSEGPDKSTSEVMATNEMSPNTVSDAMSEKIAPAGNPDKNAYFGDLHVHTMYSFDAFIFGTTASPDEAYEFAKGAPLRHPGGFDMQLKVPLDFYGVSDHGFYLGALKAMADPESKLSKLEVAKGMSELGDADSRKAQFGKILNFITSDQRDDLLDPRVFKDAWDDIIAAANRHNDPGKFTTFIAYEFTSSLAQFENLHRNVIFKGDSAPELPFTRLDSLNPEDLWQWMDEERELGFESLAIPHNSNGSNGEMLKLATFNNNPLSRQYAETRMRNEPLIEISQVKGTSDTHPALSPNDEWANFEIMPYRIASKLPSKPEGSYVREALKNGLELQEKKGFNPFKFGVVGSSDTHNATWSGDEDNYWSKVGLTDDDPVERGSVPMAEPDGKGNAYADTYYQTWSAAGLAGVWAERNTRDDIYSALRNKETFGTSGTRIKVRFFAGHELPRSDDPELIARAYESGVPMGSDLIAESGKTPAFLIWASRDANSAGLQRAQIIKASISNGKTTEKVFDVACSDGGIVDARSHRCPDNGATVNLETCAYSQDLGAAELKTLWKDPEYNPTERAMYYVRVLENPTCRWSTWDAIRAGVTPRQDLPATLQERAWTSPIWVEPAA